MNEPELPHEMSAIKKTIDGKEAEEKQQEQKQAKSREYDRGYTDGSMQEAINSLLNKFTEKELDALQYIFWRSGYMDHVRKRLDYLEGNGE